MARQLCSAPWPTKLYVVHGSHPCAAVERALEIKGARATVGRAAAAAARAGPALLFGARTVPGVALRGRREALGLAGDHARAWTSSRPSRRCCRPTPSARARVERAEEWGDEVWQPIARRLLWRRFAAARRAMARYQEGSRLPAARRRRPRARRPVDRPRRAPAERRRREGAVRADLRALPGHLDRIDALDRRRRARRRRRPTPPTCRSPRRSRLMLTIGDVRAVLRRAPGRARTRTELFPEWAGRDAAGRLPGGVARRPPSGSGRRRGVPSRTKLADERRASASRRVLARRRCARRRSARGGRPGCAARQAPRRARAGRTRRPGPRRRARVCSDGRRARGVEHRRLVDRAQEARRCRGGRRRRSRDGRDPAAVTSSGMSWASQP